MGAILERRLRPPWCFSMSSIPSSNDVKQARWPLRCSAYPLLHHFIRLDSRGGTCDAEPPHQRHDQAPDVHARFASVNLIPTWRLPDRPCRRLTNGRALPVIRQSGRAWGVLDAYAMERRDVAEPRAPSSAVDDASRAPATASSKALGLKGLARKRLDPASWAAA